MLPFPDFRFEAPDTLDDLLALAAAPGARLLAGGTDLLPNLKHRVAHADLLVSLSRVPGLGGVADAAGGLAIGARTTLHTLARDPHLIARYPALAAACRTVATPTLQRMATLGGNLALDTRCLYYNQPEGWRSAVGGCLKADGSFCHVARTGTGCYAAHSADTVPALWLYGATVVAASAAGTRAIALPDLFGADGRDGPRLRPGEVITRIDLPPPGAPVAHRKLRARGAIDYGLLLVAVQREGDGARAVLSALGPRPLEVRADRAADLPEAAWAAARPLNTHAWSTTWRRHMVRVEVLRALEALDG